MLVLAVEKDKIREGFRWERRVVKKEVKLLETATWILLNIHKSLVVESDWVKFILISRWHV